ncbi:MAG TPA: hypothetical protein VF577_03035 [Allosphingosinicella sp.]
MAERALKALALGAVPLLAGCGEAAAPANQTVAAPPPPAAASGSVAAAQRLVRQRLGNADLRFGAPRVYRGEGVEIVCGTYAEGRAAEQRFIAVSDVDVFLEPQMEPGEMDRADAEFCRDRPRNA